MKRSLCPRALLLCAVALWGVPITSARAVESLPPELNLVPRDSALFATLRVTDLWSNPTLKPILELMGGASALEQMEGVTGFAPKSVERITAFLPSLESEPILIVTTVKPYDLAKILEIWNGRTLAEDRKPSIGVGVPSSKPFPKEVMPPKSGPRPEPEFAPKDEGSPRIKREAPVPPSAPKAEERKHDLTAPYYIARQGQWQAHLIVPVDEKTLIFASYRSNRENEIFAWTTQLLRAQKVGPLSPALELAAGKNTVVIGANVPMIRGKILSVSEAIKMLPIRSLLAAKSGALTLNLSEDLVFEMFLNCADADAAKKAKDLLNAYRLIAVDMVPGLADQVASATHSDEMNKVFQVLEKTLENATVAVKENQAEMTLKVPVNQVLIKSVTDAITTIQEASRRASALNNLKQMALATHVFSDVNAGNLPFPGRAQGDEKPKLSWRVEILPYIEQNALYNQFHRDEPWDSEHNKKLIPLMPKVFEIPGSSAPKGQTYFRGNDLLKKYTIGNIPDGTSNTIMIYEAADPVIWTKPDEMLPLDPKKMPKFGGHFKRGFLIGMCDGSVRMVNDSINPLTLYHAFGPDDGQVLGSDW